MRIHYQGAIYDLMNRDDRRVLELPALRPTPYECRLEERILDLERSLREERRALRQADAFHDRLAFRYFEQTLFAQPRVFPTKRKQLLVSSALDDTAVIKHENLVCAYDSGKPVRDYDGSTVEHQSLQRFLDESLRRRVDARRRFIQNQNWWILQECPRNRKALLFAHTQLHSALPHNAAQSVRQPIDEGTRVCHRRCLQQFFIRRIRLPNLQVLADGAVKQKAFLRHHPDLLPQCANVEITNRVSAD